MGTFSAAAAASGFASVVFQNVKEMFQQPVRGKQKRRNYKGEENRRFEIHDRSPIKTEFVDKSFY